MPMELVLNGNSTGKCVASGELQGFISLNTRVMSTRVLVDGAPIMTEADKCPVIACKSQVPCTFTDQWTITALRVTSGGKRILHETSMGICSTSGHPTIIKLSANQSRVRGT